MVQPITSLKLSPERGCIPPSGASPLLRWKGQRPTDLSQTTQMADDEETESQTGVTCSRALLSEWWSWDLNPGRLLPETALLHGPSPGWHFQGDLPLSTSESPGHLLRSWFLTPPQGLAPSLWPKHPHSWALFPTTPGMQPPGFPSADGTAPSVLWVPCPLTLARPLGVL